MTRIATPFDHFMAEFASWNAGAWLLWIALMVAVALAVVVVTISKRRARERARIPQYRRSDH